MNEFCTSGRAIPEINQYDDRPCGERLVVIAKSRRGKPVVVCPACDRLPRGRADG